jgi:hypothetical protein
MPPPPPSPPLLIGRVVEESSSGRTVAGSGVLLYGLKRRRLDSDIPAAGVPNVGNGVMGEPALPCGEFKVNEVKSGSCLVSGLNGLLS